MADILNESMIRDPLDGFTDREEVLIHFQHLLFLARTSETHLLAVKGLSGTGKTLLIEYLSKRICPQVGWQTGVLAFAQSFPDFRMLLDGVEDGLKKCVPRQSLKQYRILREEYKRRFDEYRANITVHQTVEAKDASSLSNIQMNVQINAELRRREMQLRAELTRALLELAEECEHPLCLFIDGYERLAEMDPEFVGWLWEEVLLRLSKKASKPILLVTCGWEHPMNAVIQPFSTNKELDDFDLVRVKSYLQTQGIILSNTYDQELLVRAFYDFSKGHPFVLALAVMYFQTLPETERTPESLHTKKPLLFEEARVQWLEERLLKRLPEPYRTLLEYGPILRFFDQATLKALLSAKLNGKQNEMTLDDRGYERFLRYPFINQKSTQNSGLREKPIFHDLMRNVGLEALRRLHPETKQQLHCVMAEYYGAFIEIVQQSDSIWHVKSLDQISANWSAAIPELEFDSLLEWFYHALHMKGTQAEAFDLWQNLTGRTITRWQHKQAGSLLELVRQMGEEGEPFLEKQSDHYGQYLAWYSRFLEQEARWDDALFTLQEALRIFEQRGDLSNQAGVLNNIGTIYQQQGQLERALDYHERALTIRKQVDNLTDIACSLNNIGAIYRQQGQLEQALDCLQRALTFSEQAGDPLDTARSLDSLAAIYYSQGQSEQALDCLQRALAFSEQAGDPLDTAHTLHNIGAIYQQQGQLERALDYHERALTIRKQVGNLTDTARSLDDIGAIYQQQGQLERALDYSQQSLTFSEQVGNLTDTARYLNNIGAIYQQQGQLERALDYLQRALTFSEQVNDPADTIVSLNNIGAIYQQQGQLERALDYLQRALTFSEQMGNLTDTAHTLDNIGALSRQQGNLEKALDYYERALTMREQLGNSADTARSLNNIGAIYQQQGNLEKTLDYYEQALTMREQAGNSVDTARSLNNIGAIYQQQGQLERALDYLQRALTFSERVGNLTDTACYLNNIEAIYQQQDRWQDALSISSKAVSLYEQMGHGFEANVADKLEEMAACYYMLGEIEKGVSYYKRAEQIREQLQKSQE